MRLEFLKLDSKLKTKLDQHDWINYRLIELTVMYLVRVGLEQKNLRMIHSGLIR